MPFYLFLVCVLVGVSPVESAAQPKYGVTVQTVQAAALAKVRTYAWTVSRPSPDKSIDALIVAAIDRELAARGFMKVASGPSDVTVTYASVSRTDVDLKSKPSTSGALSEVTVGTLIVDLASPAKQVLFRVRTDTPIERNLATRTAAIDGAVAAMFEKYPSPPKR